MDSATRIYVAGHRGLVGSAVVRALEAHGFANLVLRTRAELDLLDQAAVRGFFAAEKPEVVVLAAAKVGVLTASGAAAVLGLLLGRALRKLRAAMGGDGLDV